MRRISITAQQTFVTWATKSENYKYSSGVICETMLKIRLVILDIGGTIIKYNGEAIDAFGADVERYSLRFSRTELTEFKGASKRDVITLLFLRPQVSSGFQLRRTDRNARAGGLRVSFSRDTKASGRSSARPLTFSELNRSAIISAFTVRHERIAIPRFASTKVLIT